MDKTMILEAYYKGLLSTEECTKILGIDPNILLNNDLDRLEHSYPFERFTK